MFNATEDFVVVSLSRAEIAAIFNAAIQRYALKVSTFTPTDGRLTGDVCREIASNMYPLVMMSNEDLEERECQQYEMVLSYLVKQFV